MPCIEVGLPEGDAKARRARLHWALQSLCLVAAAWLAGCSAPRQPPSMPPGAPHPPTATVLPQPAPAPPAAAPSAPVPVWPLAAPAAARSWDEFQLQAARRLVAASPGRVYLGEVPNPLLAIPVLEVELTEDGHVRRIQVKRVPTQATDTVQLAKDAVYRAAPYGSMKHLDKPWTFVEVFLFDDERRFKPRTLDD